MVEIDLSKFGNALGDIFVEYPPGDYCDKCAEAVAKVLKEAGYEVAIMTIQNEVVPGTPNVRPPYIKARKPTGEYFLLGQTGFHVACRLQADQPYYFVDALVHLHFGLKAIDQSSYFALFEYPDGVEITDIREM